MSGENWTPRVGDRVKGRRGVAVYPGDPERIYTLVSATAHGICWGVGKGYQFGGVHSRDLEFVDRPRPIADVKQTRPEVDFDKRTPYQQRGWAP